jgi:hypothetical protein
MKMKRKWLTMLGLCLSVAAAASVLRADDDDKGPGPGGRPGGPGGPPPRGQQAGSPVSLGREMGAMGRAYKLIRAQVSDPTKNASTLAAVLDLEQHTLAAKGAVLHSAATMPTADAKAAKHADYQGDMVTLLRHELDLEEALLANDNTKAAKAAADLHDLEEEGHKEFRPKKGD